MAIQAAGDNCGFITKTDELLSKQDKKNYLVICNTIGSPVDTRFTCIEVSHSVMTQYVDLPVEIHCIH